jgi:hypothetical protein
MPKRHNKKGRSTTERFVSLPYYLLDCPAWLSLSPVARSVFVELARLFNGSNNGFLALSARAAAERVGCSKNTAALAFHELQKKGFIEIAQAGYFDRKSSHAAEYRLTLHECHRTHQRASKAFMPWRPDQPSKSEAGPIRGTASPTSGTVQANTQ